VSASDAAVKLVEDALAEKQEEIDKVAGSLIVERDELVAFLKKATRGSKTGSSPAVDEGDLLAAVAHCSKEGPAKSKDIAKFLGVDPRSISRKLSAWATEGKVQGNKDDGYSA
jgi:hypothetical protein